MLEEIQANLYGRVVQFLPEPHGSLLSGILLGLQDSIPADFYDALIETGTIHVVAASGFNTSIIAKVLLDTLSVFLPKKVAIFGSAAGIIIFAFISGGSASVIRAAIMSLAAYIALFLGREYLASWSLIITSCLMLLVIPGIHNSLSFWLSVTATAGVLWLSPSTNSGISQIESSLVKYGITRSDNPKQGKLASSPLVINVIKIILVSLKSDLQTTLAAQVATLPIVFVIFGRISLIAPLVNVALLWLIPPIMLLGAFKLFMGGLWVFLGYVWGILVFLPLNLFIMVVQLSSQLPFASIQIVIPESINKGVLLLCVYLIYIILVVLAKGTKRSTV